VARAPAVHSTGSHSHAGGGKINGAAIVAVLVILPIVVAIVAANAAAEARARAADAAAFDGWVSVAPDHVLRLNYARTPERTIPLSRLSQSDLVGARFGVLREQDGPIIRLPGG
jgi:hypothetical protein